MPDDLDRAVDAQIDAHRPDRVPPFDAVIARKRGRDRRRLATGGAALSAVALAGAPVLAPSLAGGDGDRDRLPSYAAPAPPAPDFDVTDGYAGEYRQGTWATRSVSADRRSVVVAVAGGGCTGYGRHETVRERDRLRLSVWVETLVPQDDSHTCAMSSIVQPVTVELPRPLGEDETLLGGCEDPASGADPAGCRGLGGTPAERVDEPVPSPVASITQARRDCGGGDNPVLVGKATGIPDGATVEVVDGDGQSRGTAPVTDGEFTVYLEFRGYINPQDVPTITPGGELVVRGPVSAVLTKHPFDLTDLGGVPICG